MTIGPTDKRAFHGRIVNTQNMSSLFCPYFAHAGTDGLSTWLMKTGVTHLWWGEEEECIVGHLWKHKCTLVHDLPKFWSKRSQGIKGILYDELIFAFYNAEVLHVFRSC